MDEKLTYGFVGERSRWIRWEFAAVVGFCLLFNCLFSLLGFLQYGPFPFIPIRWLELAYFGGLCIPLLWLIWMSGDSLDMFELQTPTKRDVYWLIGLGAAVVAESIFWLFSDVTDSNGFFGGSGLLCLHCFTLGFIMYILPAVFEEVLYRGILQARTFEITGRAWVAIGFPAALFSVSHVYQGTDSLWVQFLFGVVFGVARWKGATLWTLVVVHAASNAMLTGNPFPAGPT